MSVIPPDAYVMILGAMRCGTTSLYRYLSEHPAVCPSITKEPEFFSESQAHRFRVSRYEDLWRFDPARHRLALEASTGYTKYPAERGVPRRVAAYGLRPRFLYLVRNPFERIESHFAFMRGKRGAEPFSSLSDDHLIAVSNYYLQLERFRPFFPRKDFLILDFDELKTTPESLLEKVYAFLDLSGERGAASVPAFRRARRPSRAESFLRAAPLARRLVQALPAEARRRGKNVLATISGETPIRRVNPTEREVIFGRLRADMERFEREYGFDVRKWGFGRMPAEAAAPRAGLPQPARSPELGGAPAAGRSSAASPVRTARK